MSRSTQNQKIGFTGIKNGLRVFYPVNRKKRSIYKVKSDVYMQTDRLCKGDLNNPLYKSLSFKNKKYSLKFYKYFKEFYYICKDKKR